MDFNEIIEQYVNGNIATACNAIENYGGYAYFKVLQNVVDIDLYCQMSISYIYYAENK